MKASAITLALASFAISASPSAHEVNEARESNVQAQFFTVAAAPRTPERDIQKKDTAQKENKAKANETSNTQPDPALLPYVNGGHYASK